MSGSKGGNRFTVEPELITDTAGFAPLEDEWRALAELRGNAFITPEWFRSWWEQRPESISPLVIAVRRDDRSLAGVMPLVLDAQRRPRAIRFAGATWGDRFAPAAREDDEVAVAAAAMVALQRQGLDRYLLDLDHVDVERPWWGEMKRASGPRYVSIEQQRFEVPYIELDDLDWESYLATRSRNFRQQLRQRERRLSEHHRVGVRSATEQTLNSDLSHFFDLHERRWQGRGQSALQTPGVRQFLRDFAASAQRRGWLRLRLLEVDGSPVAAFLGWRLGDVYAFYQSGFDPAWAKMSVGIVLMADTIRSAMEEGAAEFDMLLGNEPYKQRFTNGSRDVHTVIVTRATSPTRLLVAGESWVRRHGRGLGQRRGLDKLSGAMRRLLPTVDRF
jgi:CelD/BcsL family acetyltransferase involved in cellulose biosynthesis